MLTGKSIVWMRLALGVGVTACGLAAEAGGQQPTPAKQYLIRCKLTETGADGTPQTLASPNLITTVGTPAEVMVGSEVSPQIAEGKAATAYSGLQLKATILRVKDAKLVLDATLAVTTTLDSNDKRTRVVVQTVRNVEPLALNQAIRVPVDGRNDKQLEITVEEANPVAVAKPSVPPVAGPAEKPVTVAAPPLAAIEPTPVTTPQSNYQPSSGGGNPLRGPLNGIRGRLRGR